MSLVVIQLLPDGSKAPLPVPHALTEEQMADLKQQFVVGARNALAAGFDGVEVHSAHGCPHLHQSWHNAFATIITEAAQCVVRLMHCVVVPVSVTCPANLVVTPLPACLRVVTFAPFTISIRELLISFLLQCWLLHTLLVVCRDEVMCYIRQLLQVTADIHQRDASHH